MSHTIVSAVVGLLALLLGTLGVDFMPGELEGFVTKTIEVGSLIYIWYRRWETGDGDVTPLGVRN